MELALPSGDGAHPAFARVTKRLRDANGLPIGLRKLMLKAIVTFSSMRSLITVPMGRRLSSKTRFSRRDRGLDDAVKPLLAGKS